jgi:membrane protein implicated in regulation of membrane protease activity
MAQRNHRARGLRNTAPMWKKLTLIAAAIAAPVVLVTLLNATKWSFVLFLLLVVGSAAAALWGTAKLVGVHLTLANWDDAPRGSSR